MEERPPHPKDIDRFLEKRRASLTSGALFEDEVRIRCGPTGEYRWFIISVPAHSAMS